MWTSDGIFMAPKHWYWGPPPQVYKNLTVIYLCRGVQFDIQKIWSHSHHWNQTTTFDVTDSSGQPSRALVADTGIERGDKGFAPVRSKTLTHPTGSFQLGNGCRGDWRKPVIRSRMISRRFESLSTSCSRPSRSPSYILREYRRPISKCISIHPLGPAEIRL